MLAEYTASMGIDTETIRLASLTLPHDMYIFSEDEIARFNLFYIRESSVNNDQGQEAKISASQLPDDGIFWRQDGWKVEIERHDVGWYCDMNKRAEKGGGIFALHASRTLPSILMLYVNHKDVMARFVKGNKKKANITLSFNGVEKRLILADYDKGEKASTLGAFLQKQDITNIYNRNEISLSVRRRLLASISLKGSAKALQALNRCYEMLP